MKQEIYEIISESDSKFRERALDVLEKYESLCQLYQVLESAYDEGEQTEDEDKEFYRFLYKETGAMFKCIDRAFDFLAQNDLEMLIYLFENQMDFEEARKIVLGESDGDYAQCFLKPLLMLSGKCRRLF
jgi:hypothetical protein